MNQGCYNCKYSRFIRVPEYDWLVAKCLAKQNEDGTPYISENIFSEDCEEWEKARNMEKLLNLARFAKGQILAQRNATTTEIRQSITEEPDKPRYILYGFVLGLCTNVVVLMIIEVVLCRQ